MADLVWLALYILFEAPKSESFWPFWQAIGIFAQAAALVVTLVYINKYTNATKEMAKATAAMAEADRATASLQQQMVELQRMPVMSLQCADPNDSRFPIAFRNIGNSHAKLRIRVHLFLDDRDLALPDSSRYNGHYVWSLHAVGPGGPWSGGHPSLDGILRHNGIDPGKLNRRQRTVRIQMDAWVINYSDDETGLYDNKHMDPTRSWIWKPIDMAGITGTWITEVAPDTETEAPCANAQKPWNGGA